MKVSEISGENLEDLLAYDDVFLDYFNQFLVSSVFPQQIIYNRLTGTFEEVSSDVGDLSQSIRTLKYGATDKERERMLEWARERRLNLFLESHLFRELKLCKQLLRPIDDQRTNRSQGSSQMIRGYSRQTNSCVSSLSNGISQPNEPDAEAFLHGNLPFSAPMTRQLFRSQNSSLQSGRAVVDDGYLTSCTQKDRETLMSNSKTPKSALSSLKKNSLPSQNLKKLAPAGLLITSDSSSACQSATSGLTPKSCMKVREVTFSRENTMLSYNCDSEGNKELTKKSSDDSSLTASKSDLHQFARALSAPVNYRDFLRIAWFSRFDLLFGVPDMVETGDLCPYLQFPDGGNSDANMDLHNLEGRLQMTLQQVKEQVLGSYHGMQRFKNFLANTFGCHLVKFWLHCELFRDFTEDHEDQNLSRNRNQLFRDIQSKYRMSLTKEAREQIQRASNNVSLHHTIFIRAQYDVLRRLRAYWVPRFLLHLERNTDTISSLSSSRRSTPKWLSRKERCGWVRFPSISISQHPLCLASTWGYNHVANEPNNADERDVIYQVSNTLKNGSNRFLIALTNDQKYGGPFRKYLSRQNSPALLQMLSFWQDVSNYGSEESDDADRHLQHERAWDIYHKYLANHDKQNIDICNKVRDTIYNTLLNTKNVVSASIFNPVKEEVVLRLEAAWKRSLQEDFKSYLDCKTRAQGGTPPSTADFIEISLQDGKLLIKRPHPWTKRTVDVSLELGQHISTLGKVEWAKLDEETKRLRMYEIMEEKRRRDRNRKQAIRTARRRQQEERLMARKMQQKPEVPRISRIGDGGSPPMPTFKDFLDNKPVISSFKKCIYGVQNGPQVGHMVNLYSEIENLKALIESDSSKAASASKEVELANRIQKTYLSENSSKFIPMLCENKERSLLIADGTDELDNNVLGIIQEKIADKIENAFETFLMTRSDDAGVSEEELVHMNSDDLIDLLTKTEKDETTQVAKKPIGQRKKLKQEWIRNCTSDFLSPKADGLSFRGAKHGRQALSSHDDELELRQALNQCASDQFNLQMIYFHIYLYKHADEEHRPFLDKDLFFYIECQKAKECLTDLFDENEHRRRLEVILENYLQSESTPQVKVDLSQDVCQRTVKMVQQCLSTNEYDQTVFDEALAHIFKELLPYWTGFRKSFRSQNHSTQIKSPKPEKQPKIHDDSLKNNVFHPKQVTLPTIPHSTVRVLSFSLADGTKWRPASTSYSMHLSMTSSHSKSSEQ